MPAMHYWFSGGALTACAGFFVAILTLGLAWYQAAVKESEIASSKAESAAQTGKTQHQRTVGQGVSVWR